MVIGYMLSSEATIRGYSRSSYFHMKMSSPSEARLGPTRRRMTLRQIPKVVHPSILPASIKSFEMDFIRAARDAARKVFCGHNIGSLKHHQAADCDHYDDK